MNKINIYYVVYQINKGICNWENYLRGHEGGRVGGNIRDVFLLNVSPEITSPEKLFQGTRDRRYVRGHT